MGQSQSFTREELEVYEACTCLSGAEILALHDKFRHLGGVRVQDEDDEKVVRGAGAHLRLTMPDVETGNEATSSTSTRVSQPVPVKKARVTDQSELRHNPFKDRLCEIFSSFDAADSRFGDLTFDEFVDLYNVMSPRASKEVKMQTAFRLYDYDGNGYLTPEDITELVKTLSTAQKGRELLTEREIHDVVDRVMRDCKLNAHTILHHDLERIRVISRAWSPNLPHLFALPSQVTSTETLASHTPSSPRWSIVSRISRSNSACACSANHTSYTPPRNISRRATHTCCAHRLLPTAATFSE